MLETSVCALWTREFGALSSRSVPFWEWLVLRPRWGEPACFSAPESELPSESQHPREYLGIKAMPLAPEDGAASQRNEEGTRCREITSRLTACQAFYAPKWIIYCRVVTQFLPFGCVLLRIELTRFGGLRYITLEGEDVFNVRHARSDKYYRQRVAGIFRRPQ